MVEMAPKGKTKSKRPEKITEQIWPSGTMPLVSIICTTYNHEEYIEKCLNGFLLQETTFPIEIIVHDDASTDRTREILKTYCNQYPQLFRPIFQLENKLKHGIRPVPIAISESKGKYIAFCEGDDYWIDKDKLEEQIGQLKINKDAQLSFHRVHIENSLKPESESKKFPELDLKPEYKFDELLKSNIIPTASVVARREAVHQTPDWFSRIPMNDWPRWIMACLNGPALASNKAMGVYRIHDNGLWSGLSTAKQISANLDFYYTLSMFGPKEISDIANREREVLIASIIGQNYGVRVEDRLSQHILFGPLLRFWQRFINRSFPKFNKTIKHSSTPGNSPLDEGV